MRRLDLGLSHVLLSRLPTHITPCEFVLTKNSPIA